MVATKHDMKELERVARRQGWKVTQTGSNHLRWTPPHGRAVMTSLTPSNNYAINMIERDLVKAGLKLGVEYEKKEKPVPSVADLIKANGTGEPLPKPEPKVEEPHKGGKRTSRAGLDRDIVTVLKAVYPREMDFTTLKMKVSINHPGLSQPGLHAYLSKLKIAGKVLNTRMGYYRVASADVEVGTPTVTTPVQREPLVPVLPGEYKAVIDNLITAVDAAEKLIVRLTRQLAEQTEAAETIKRLAAKL